MSSENKGGTRADTVFCVKMRASQKISDSKSDAMSADGSCCDSRHISGAERIVRREELGIATQSMLERALKHSLGEPDSIHLKIEKIDVSRIQKIPALPVSSVTFSTPEEGHQEIVRLLEFLGIGNVSQIMRLLEETGPMRGAMLLDSQTLERLEPDRKRGVRATWMDYFDAESVYPPNSTSKNHFLEALALASKVIAHPNIVAEICISDDPQYVTGYVASKIRGYQRISPLKHFGDSHGGRIFLFRTLHGTKSRQKQIEDCIFYLQNQPVWILKETEEGNLGK